MSIPLNRLYHYLDSLSSDDVIIYHWSPHGSKNLNDLTTLKAYDLSRQLVTPICIAHDQEPLDFDFLESQPSVYSGFHSDVPGSLKLRLHSMMWNVFDKSILIHSEKNSKELEKFSQHCIGVYYWSHALLARDWFRYAAHDPILNYNPALYTYDFLIYNRAWSGTREYRLKFMELLVGNNLEKASLTSFSPVDSNVHYSLHKFANPALQISNSSLELLLPLNTHQSSASADYNSNDYTQCGIEVVLETLFDDERNHLTEKILRPIACGKPFMIASTANSLGYLRDYGFKTFSNYIDESYDTIVDSVSRLESIISEMHRISNLPHNEKMQLFSDLNEIAAYNKNLFFSQDFHQQVVDEFKDNMSLALHEVRQHKNAQWWTKTSYLIDTMPGLVSETFAPEHINIVREINEQVIQESSVLPTTRL